jgi:hypothetical protein
LEPAAKDSDNNIEINQNILTTRGKIYSINKLEMDALKHMSNGYGAQPTSYFTGARGSFPSGKATRA